MAGQRFLYQRRLVLLFFAVKTCVFLIAALCAILIEPYNPSIGMLLFPKAEPFISTADYWIKTLLRPFASWDGAYFLINTIRGYNFEQQHAFFPLYPLLIRGLADLLFRPFISILSLPARCIISAVLISNLCHFMSVMILYDMSCHIFEDTYFAFLSAAFMIIVPMQAIMSSAYSESLFTCLALLGLLYFYRKERLSASLAWCLAGATRSNGIFMPGFFIYEYMHAIRHMPKRKALLRLVRILILCLISWTGFFGVLLFGKSLYCNGDTPRPWCNSLFPNIYAYVQDHYWNVGFLRYYTVHQLPNFFLASPTIIFSITGILEYVKTDWVWAATLGLSHRSLTIKKRPYHNRALLPHIYLWAFMLVYSMLFVHVQIMTRLFMFMPVVCWYHAHLYYMAGSKTRGSISQRKLHLFLLGSFSTITSILFFSFYPPA